MCVCARARAFTCVHGVRVMSAIKVICACKKKVKLKIRSGTMVQLVMTEICDIAHHPRYKPTFWRLDLPPSSGGMVKQKNLLK